MWETIAAVAAAGGRVIAGTDTPIVPYGLGFIIEIEQLAEAGLGPAGAIRAATLTAAEALGLAGELGVIAPGCAGRSGAPRRRPPGGHPQPPSGSGRLSPTGGWATLDQLLGF